MSNILIGEARISENGTIFGDLPGDQTGSEVAFRDFYDLDKHQWVWVFRANTEEAALRLANAMLQACINNNVGYTQMGTGPLANTRYGLYYAMVKTGCILDVKEPCGCDCSSLVADCCIISGIDVSRYMSTANEESLLDATKKFTKHSYDEDFKLCAGDILLKPGHTAIVVASDNPYNPRMFVAQSKLYTHVYEDRSGTRTLNKWPLLGPGNLVDVVREEGDMYKIRIMQLYSGWVHKNDLEAV